MSASDHGTTYIEVYRKRNAGTDFRPLWVWDLVLSTTGLRDKLSESKIIRNEGGVVLADYVYYTDYADIRSDDRIKAGSSFYDVFNAYDPNDMNDHLEIFCKLLPAGDDMGVS